MFYSFIFENLKPYSFLHKNYALFSVHKQENALKFVAVTCKNVAHFKEYTLCMLLIIKPQ